MKTALFVIFLMVFSPTHAAYKRNSLEEKLCEWANTRSSGSEGPGTLLWSLVQMKDYWKMIRNYHGVISQHTVLNGLIRVRSAVDYYIKQGDLE
jgi:hypothetical protein